jgi:formylglycine-generating enzyme required for sulfatase activity
MLSRPRGYSIYENALSLMNSSAAKMWPAVLAVVLSLACAHVRPEAQSDPPNAGRWTNSLGMIFLPVAHTEVSFSIYETRVWDFAAFAATQPALDGTNWNHALYHDLVPVSNGPDFPVVNVSWNDATKFCAWLTGAGRKTGEISANEYYRLPTDAEWSWAVGIGGHESGSTPREMNAKLENVYPWGTQFPPPPGAGNFADEAAFHYFTNWPHIEGYNDGFVTTAPVGSFPPNAAGLYDLAGNAMEWCSDLYQPGHNQRVLRGGAWINCGPKSLWSSARNHAAPNKYSVATGFRCVLAAKPQS